MLCYLFNLTQHYGGTPPMSPKKKEFLTMLLLVFNSLLIFFLAWKAVDFPWLSVCLYTVATILGILAIFLMIALYVEYSEEDERGRK